MSYGIVRIFLAGALLAGGAVQLGCQPEGPSYRRDRNVRAIPIARSNRERANKITYYLASVEQKGDRVIVDMDVTNGHSTQFRNATLFVTLLGTNGESYLHRHPLGPLGQHNTDHAVFRVKDIPFEVDDVTVAIQLSQ